MTALIVSFLAGAFTALVAFAVIASLAMRRATGRGLNL